ncbi:hypothetical protein NDA18_006092 [Ustilago nuda]|nr:hypothetical protein NDA18_006092 [Ustilago nuda]
MSPYSTRSKTTANAPPAGTAMTSSRRRRVVLRLKPWEDPAAGADPSVPLASAHVADPSPAPVVRLPLEPLFLGMDDDVVIPSPLPSPFLAPVVPDSGNDASPTFPTIDLYEVDTRRSAVEVTTPEQQAAWEAELARSPTPPPTADEVVDAVLAASKAGTPVFRPEVQPLNPPPPDRHLPSNREITGWAEGFVTAKLLTRVADGYYLRDWDVPAGSLPARRLHRLVMLHLTEGCIPWPSWQCHCCFNLGVPDAGHLAPLQPGVESGGPPDPINSWVTPTEEELVLRLSLAPPPPPSSYVDM